MFYTFSIIHSFSFVFYAITISPHRVSGYFLKTNFNVFDYFALHAPLKLQPLLRNFASASEQKSDVDLVALFNL